MKALKNFAMEDPLIRKYLPEPDQISNKGIPKDFFFGVITTLKPTEVQKLVDDALNKRFKAEESQSSHTLMVSKEWAE
jgi:hypothetical protein